MREGIKSLNGYPVVHFRSELSPADVDNKQVKSRRALVDTVANRLPVCGDDRACTARWGCLVSRTRI